MDIHVTLISGIISTSATLSGCSYLVPVKYTLSYQRLYILDLKGVIMANSETRLIVLISGSGTNLQALIDACINQTIPNARIVRVVSNRKSACNPSLNDLHTLCYRF